MFYRLFLFVLPFFCLLLSGCPFPYVDHGPPFLIQVTDQNSNPVVEAVVIAQEYYFDPAGSLYMYCSYLTDSDGFVELPGSANNRTGYIIKTNMQPLEELIIPESVYTLNPTRREFELIGEVENTRNLFYKQYILSLNAYGKYSVYELSEEDLVELGSAMFSISNEIYSYYLYHDTIWLSVINEGIYAFDISEILHPSAFLFKRLPGQLRLQAVNDSLVILDTGGNSPISVYKYKHNSELNWEFNIPNVGYASIKLIDGKVFFTNGDGMYSYDLSGADAPMRIFSQRDNHQKRARFLNQYAIIESDGFNRRDSSAYDFYDISNPASPVIEETVYVPSWNAFCFLNKNQVFGKLHYDSWHGGYALFERAETSESFSLTGLMSIGRVSEVLFPYLIDGEQVYIIN
ncbi:MAG: hypothetical protein P9X24_17630 [Candidatus Hatepunaea meridiana]|nr:hypothetical protein [Candidatus Hatepunaea meridiana]